MNKIESELNYLGLCLTKWDNCVWKLSDPKIYSEYKERYNYLINEKKKISNFSQTTQMLP